MSRFGDDPGPADRLVLVHGFTQTGASWEPVATALRHRFEQRTGTIPEFIAPDAPGHGSSSHLHLDLRAGADHLGDACGRATYVGYSMGGRLCLHLALARPRLVDRLVLIGATAGIDRDAERANRRHADEALARELERDGVDAFLERWLAQPLFATLPTHLAGVPERRRNTVEGLAASFRLAGTGSQEPLWDRLHELAMPVLVVAGERDEKFSELGRRLTEATPNATFATVPDAGHAAHLEDPRGTATVIVDWVAAQIASQIADEAG